MKQIAPLGLLLDKKAEEMGIATKQELSKRLNIHYVLVHRYRVGEIMPSISALKRISQSLNVSYSELLDASGMLNNLHKTDHKGKRLKIARIKAGIEDKDAAEAIGMSPKAFRSREVAYYGGDRGTTFTDDECKKLIKLYGVTEDIFEELPIVDRVAEKEQIRINFVNRLKGMMKSRGLTSNAIWKLCGLSPSTTYDWLVKKKYPRLEGVVKIATLLGVTSEELLDPTPYVQEEIEVDVDQPTMFLRLEALRRQSGLTITVVGEATGMSRSAYWRIENGYVNTLTKDQLNKLIQLYNVTKEFILGEDGLLLSEDNISELARILRRARLNLSMSVMNVADKMGVRHTRIANSENKRGLLSYWTINEIRELANIYEIDKKEMDELLEGYPNLTSLKEHKSKCNEIFLKLKHVSMEDLGRVSLFIDELSIKEELE